MKKGLASLQFQLTISLVLLVVIISGVLTIVQFARYSTDFDQTLRQNLLTQVTTAALSIDGDTFGLINADTDRESPEYLKIITPIKKIFESNPDLGGVYTIAPDGSGGWIFVVDGDPNPIKIGTPIEDLSAILQENSTGITEPAVERDYYTDDWGTWLTGYAPIHTRQGEVVGALAMDIAQSTIREKQNQLLLVSSLIFVISLVFSVFMGWLISYRIVHPIKKVSILAKSLAERDLPELALACDRLAEGDLNQHIEITSDPVEYQSKSELGNMASDLNFMITHLKAVGESFNRMAQSFTSVLAEFGDQTQKLSFSADHMKEKSSLIEAQVSQIQNAIQIVDEGSQHQMDSVVETRDRLGKIVETVSSVAQGAGEQSKAVSDTDVVMDEFSRLIEIVVKNADDQAQTARHSTETVKQSAGVVEMAVESMRRIQVIVRESSQKMQEMGEQTRQIETMLAAITDIASQTNLLSLNAAIEAARAGEHGKGFSIVADEVRKLADKSSTAAKEISTLIARIEKSASEASTAMQNSQKEVESGVQMGEKAGEALIEILDSVKQSQISGERISDEANKMVTFSDRLTDSLDRVSAIAQNYQVAVEQMSAYIESIQGTMDRVNEISRENSGSIEIASSQVTGINQGMDEFSSSSAELSALSGKLRSTLARFNLADKNA
ncbi:MAG: HAMP domain-containing protein [Leptolinea sp.]|jgi:methyl-accepting chemotaxis protein|nr:HAMP domain-containing protein [Leptolinea sp.]